MYSILTCWELPVCPLLAVLLSCAICVLLVAGLRITRGGGLAVDLNDDGYKSRDFTKSGLR